MRKKFLIAFISFFFSIFTFPVVRAHCPLCTIGAAFAAGGAAYLGVNTTIIGLFIGAFAVSTGWWVARLVKRQFIPFQAQLLILFSFLTTVLPLKPLLTNIYPVLISFAGSYGSLLNRTYLIDLFLVGAIIGGLIVSITPWLSKKIGELRNGKMMPYQGILLTLAILLVTAGILQIIVP